MAYTHNSITTKKLAAKFSSLPASLTPDPSPSHSTLSSLTIIFPYSPALLTPSLSHSLPASLTHSQLPLLSSLIQSLPHLLPYLSHSLFLTHSMPHSFTITPHSLLTQLPHSPLASLTHSLSHSLPTRSLSPSLSLPYLFPMYSLASTIPLAPYLIHCLISVLPHLLPIRLTPYSLILP